MSDRMTPIPFGNLMDWILTEKGRGSVFGIRRPYSARSGKMLDLFSEHLETPFGPAAGPHTQLAQNIIAAYYAGSRFFELKTVQTLDGEDLPVSKPCISAPDECYNVEWSTELRVEQAYEEYVKAWYALKLISRELDLGSPDGFMFNMSVGYNYEGITSPKIDNYIEGMKNASSSGVWKECEKWTLDHLDRFSRIDEAYVRSISPVVSQSITVSTLHGCPPSEIEKITSHLIDVKKLNSFVKCNPTLLGYDFARRTMDQMGYDYLVFDDFHFRDDLQYRDAVPMFKRLQSLADRNGLAFGVKLTNTFPVTIAAGELPGSEMYMSGRALFALTTELVHRLSKTFDGKLRISYCGGADVHNAASLFSAGIWPITMATTMLKPGGYQRMLQIAEILEKEPYLPFTGVSVGKIGYIAKAARSDPKHTKAVKSLLPKKMDEKVPLTSCFTAPCENGCPIHQDIPEYIKLVGEGKYAEALRLILEKNPLPFITGKICSHRCMSRCTRNYYEEPVHIRDAKLLAARQGYGTVIDEIRPSDRSGRKVAVIGGGPAGMAASFFLARQNADVTLYEKEEKLGGIVRYIIPDFRISDFGIDRDVSLLEKTGVRILTGTPAPSVEELKQAGYDAIIYAVGANKHGSVSLESGTGLNVMDFLKAYHDGTLPDLGKDLVVIGAGNTAMDAARTAIRIPGVESCSIVYRRTKRYMPADAEELELALDDGVSFKELLVPVRLENGSLLCRKCVLGDPDPSGRRSSVETEETVSLPCSALIIAAGEKVDGTFFAGQGIGLDEKGKVHVNPDTLETDLPGIYVIGDANRGPSTVVECIADARKAADAIVGYYEPFIPESAWNNPDSCFEKQGVLHGYDDAGKEFSRCLGCSTICECCVQVCPNRANVAIHVPGIKMPQILHVDRMCNECGNCMMFCPYSSAPYKDKFTVFHTEQEFDTSENKGFFPMPDGTVKVRLGTVSVIHPGRGEIDREIDQIICTVLSDYRYLL